MSKNSEKKAKQAYKSLIDDLASKMMIECQKEAFNITDSVFKDILRALRDRIDNIIGEEEK